MTMFSTNRWVAHKVKNSNQQGLSLMWFMQSVHGQLRKEKWAFLVLDLLQSCFKSRRFETFAHFPVSQTSDVLHIWLHFHLFSEQGLTPTFRPEQRDLRETVQGANENLEGKYWTWLNKPGRGVFVYFSSKRSTRVAFIMRTHRSSPSNFRDSTFHALGDCQTANHPMIACMRKLWVTEIISGPKRCRTPQDLSLRNGGISGSTAFCLPAWQSLVI